ncbi:MAG: FtsW/RodA/SpoVE family cell cycle protein [Anaerovoracaceae bacterium]
MNLFSNTAGQIGSALSDFWTRIHSYIQYFFGLASSGSLPFGTVYLAVVRWIMPILALIILLSVIFRMIRVKNPKETWGYLYSDELGRFPINHWECTVGRARHCDIIVKFATISRTQCALMRDDDGKWSIHDLSMRGTTLVNGNAVSGAAALRPGDKLSIGGVGFTFHPITAKELAVQKQRRSEAAPKTPWKSFVLLTVFQILTVLEFAVTRPENIGVIAGCFTAFTVIMWIYIFVVRKMGQRGFEPELLAFFACTLNMAVTATSTPSTMIKQSAAMLIGFIGYLFLGWFLRDLGRVVKARHIFAGLCVLLFIINIVFGGVHYGARNWISVFGLSLQPSELAKVCFIFAGAATLDRLFVKRNLFGFMILSGFCLLALAITGDFGTASIFFVVFLVIAYMRSGDFATLALICGAVAGAALMVIRFKPYVAARFSVWGHAWEYADTSGYQQVRTMSAASSGGFIGVGAGNGWLHNVAASNTDLVFGILCEEWGLIIALLAVVSIITLSLFAYRVVQNGRSSYYAIAACAATSLFVFQTILNVFGSVDILPLTGVTFPFVSCGGSSMISSWCLLAFLKAADTRHNASFAVRRKEVVPATPEEAGYRPVPPVPPAPEIQRAPRGNAGQDRTRFLRRNRIVRDIDENSIISEPPDSAADKTLYNTRSFDSSEIPSSYGLTDQDIKTQQQNEDEIDSFLSQFEDERMDDTSSYYYDDDEGIDENTDEFLRQLRDDRSGGSDPDGQDGNERGND